MTRGSFIAIEGIDGSGKTTLAEAIAEDLRARGQVVTLTREPGGTPLGHAIRQLLLDHAHAPIPLAELMLYAADRAQHVNTLIKPAIDRGETVITDRYTGSTTAYQHHARGLPIDTIHHLNHLATNDLKPDLTILLDLDPRRALERTTSKRRDRIETDTLDRLYRIRRGYQHQAANDPTWVTLDAHQRPEVLLLYALSHIDVKAKVA